MSALQKNTASWAQVRQRYVPRMRRRCGMSLTSKSPRTVALEALAAGEAALPLYSHRCSPKNSSSRSVRLPVSQDFLQDRIPPLRRIHAGCPDLVSALGLECVPHFTTLQKVSLRLAAMSSWRWTGLRLQARQVSAYFVKRRAKGQKRSEKSEPNHHLHALLQSGIGRGLRHPLRIAGRR